MATGYGPSTKPSANTRFQRLCFDGTARNYQIWETKFLAYLYTQNKDAYDAITTIGVPNEDHNKHAFAELVQLIDDKSLQLLMNDARDNGKQALQLLRHQYASVEKPRILTLYTELTTLQMRDDEDITDYLIRAENASTGLKSAGETISDNLVVAMILKGLPQSFNTFVIVQGQMERIQTLTELKASLMNYVNNEALRSDKDVLMKAKYNFTRFNNSVSCLACGKQGHKSKDCYSKSKLKCRFCGKVGHIENVCFRKKKEHNYNAKSTNFIKEEQNEFTFMLTVHKTELTIPQEIDKLLVDCGATSHIINDGKAFIEKDETFNSKQHYVELANGQRTNKLLHGKGTAQIQVIDSEGKEQNILLKNALYAPSFPTSLFSVTAATKQGAEVRFNNTSAELIAANGTVFPIVKKTDLYYFVTKNEAAYKTMTLLEWHRALGHHNQQDIKSLQKVTEGMKISSTDQAECSICLENKQTKDMIPKKIEQNLKALDLIHTDLCGPIQPATKEGYRYIINFVDYQSGMGFVYFLRTKETAYMALQQFIADVAPCGKVKEIRSDNGGEFISTQFKNVLRSCGIKQTTTAPYSAHQNGKAERQWRSLMNMARCMLSDAGLAKIHWMYAVKYAQYIRNRSYQRNSGATAFELLCGKKPNMQKIHVFGSSCTYYDDCQKGKLDPRSKEGIFLGINPLNSTYWVLDHLTGYIKNSRNVHFYTSMVTDDSEFEKSSEPKQQVEDDCMPQAIEDSASIEDSALRRSNRQTKKPERLVYDSLKGIVNSTETPVEQVPKTYQEAMLSSESDKWKKAMDAEIQALERNGTWELVTLPEDRNEIKGKWVFVVKYNSNGTIDKYKARYVAKGFSQVQGQDFFETFSPTAQLTTVRVLMQLAIQSNMYLHQLDVKAAYLHAPIDADIYLEQPPGYEKYEDGKKLTCHLKKSLYGLKQSGRNWNKSLHDFFIGHGFKQSSADACLYTRKEKYENDTKVVIWVDDIIIASKNNDNVHGLINEMKQSFDIDDRGALKWFLGINFNKNANRITMDQSYYIDKILEKYQMQDCKIAFTPAEEGIQLTKCLKDENTVQTFEFDYRGAVGSLLYLAMGTRPDICWIVSKLSQFLENPEMEHVKAVKHVMRYLKGTKDLKLQFSKIQNPQLLGFSDSDWASSVDDRKSTSGYMFSLGFESGALSWKTRKQNSVALSSCEAEYIALAEMAKEAKHLQMLLNDLGFNNGIAKMFCDNQGAVALAHNPVKRQRSKHIEIRYHFIREYIALNVATLEYIRSDENVADTLTKSLGKVKFKKFLKVLLGLGENTDQGGVLKY